MDININISVGLIYNYIFYLQIVVNKIELRNAVFNTNYLCVVI